MAKKISLSMRALRLKAVALRRLRIMSAARREERTLLRKGRVLRVP
ncbi:MAG: hypothetical protein R2941_04820 [Desulfobacterales bacterium]